MNLDSQQPPQREQIRRLLNKTGWSRPMLSKKTGITASKIGRLIAGECKDAECLNTLQKCLEDVLK